MPTAQLTNIAGADGEGFSSGPLIQDVLNGDTIALPVGTLVALSTPITGTTTTQFKVATATTVAGTAPLNIGVVVGTAIGVGATGQVCVHGHCRALVDSTVSPTVAGHRLVLGGTAGSLSDSGATTATAGINYGAVLEPVTIASGTALVNIYFQKT
jgi:hypothetical protein